MIYPLYDWELDPYPFEFDFAEGDAVFQWGMNLWYNNK